MRKSVFSRLMMFVVLAMVVQGALAYTPEELGALNSRPDDIASLRALASRETPVKNYGVFRKKPQSKTAAYFQKRAEAIAAWGKMQAVAPDHKADFLVSEAFAVDKPGICDVVEQFATGQGFFQRDSGIAERLGRIYGCSAPAAAPADKSFSEKKLKNMHDIKKILSRASQYLHGYGQKKGRFGTSKKIEKPNLHRAEQLYSRALEIGENNADALIGRARVALRGGYASGLSRAKILSDVAGYIERVNNLPQSCIYERPGEMGLKPVEHSTCGEDIDFLKQEFVFFKQEVGLFSQSYTVYFTPGSFSNYLHIAASKGFLAPDANGTLTGEKAEDFDKDKMQIEREPAASTLVLTLPLPRHFTLTLFTNSPDGPEWINVRTQRDNADLAMKQQEGYQEADVTFDAGEHGKVLVFSAPEPFRLWALQIEEVIEDINEEPCAATQDDPKSIYEDAYPVRSPKNSSRSSAYKNAGITNRNDGYEEPVIVIEPSATTPAAPRVQQVDSVNPDYANIDRWSDNQQ